METKKAILIIALALFLSSFTFNPNTFLDAAGLKVLDKDGDLLLACATYYIIPTIGGGLSLKNKYVFRLRKNKGHPVGLCPVEYPMERMVTENTAMTIYNNNNRHANHLWGVNGNGFVMTGDGKGIRNRFQIVKVGKNLRGQNIYKLQSCSRGVCDDIGIRGNRLVAFRPGKVLTKTLKFRFKFEKAFLPQP